MPIYEARCAGCGVDAEYLRPVAQCLDVPDCPECGVRMEKVIRSAPVSYGAKSFDAFISTVDGSLISSQRDLKNHNERNGVVNLNEFYSDEQLKSGDVKAKSVPPPDKKSIAADIAEATAMVSAGYKPDVVTNDDIITL